MYLCYFKIQAFIMNIKSKIKAFYKGIVYNLSADNNYFFLFFYRFLYKPRMNSISDITSRFSKSRGKVTVVQIGANDGINNDPIHKFIKRDNWQGVLLEPQKYVFEKYLKPLYKKTKGITVLNAALDFKDGFKPIYKLSVSNSRWATGLTTFNRKVLEEAVRSGYVEEQARKEGIPLPPDKEDYITVESIECICTETLLKRYGLDKIDWLQIDTEGFDYEIIKMFNIEITQPDVVSYENLHLSSSDKQECKNHLKNNGYICQDFGGNTLAMKNHLNEFRQLFDQK
jgi:FkbM family methyltransferase